MQPPPPCFVSVTLWPCIPSNLSPATGRLSSQVRLPRNVWGPPTRVFFFGGVRRNCNSDCNVLGDKICTHRTRSLKGVSRLFWALFFVFCGFLLSNLSLRYFLRGVRGFVCFCKIASTLVIHDFSISNPDHFPKENVFSNPFFKQIFVFQAPDLTTEDDRLTDFGAFHGQVGSTRQKYAVRTLFMQNNCSNYPPFFVCKYPMF